MNCITRLFKISRVKKSRGQNLVEFALALPVMMALCLFTIEVGRAWHTYNAVKQAVNEGVHAAAMKHNAGAGTEQLNTKISESGVTGAGQVAQVEGYHAYKGEANATFEPIFGGVKFGIGSSQVTIIPDAFPITYSSIQDAAVY